LPVVKLRAAAAAYTFHGGWGRRGGWRRGIARRCSTEIARAFMMSTMPIML
jgi:hypothetical protein